MPDYAIRVELRGDPTWEQYDTLHKIMAKGGFLQTIVGVDSQGNQKTFNLPHAVYYGSSAADYTAVRDWTVKVVKAGVQKDILIFVVELKIWALGW
jgi:hypothetical protein